MAKKTEVAKRPTELSLLNRLVSAGRKITIWEPVTGGVAIDSHMPLETLTLLTKVRQSNVIGSKTFVLGENLPDAISKLYELEKA